MLDQAIMDLQQQVLPRLSSMSDALQQLGDLLLQCWNSRGKVLLAGNGGSAADAMHLAEEFSVRFKKDRKALAAIALCDPAAITCAGNDLGFESIFSRQVEGLGNPGDVLIVFTTSGNSPNIIRCINQAREQGLKTVAFLGKDGGKAKGMCDFEFIIPVHSTARVQEAHKILYHVLCEWIDAQVE